jgi:hypothetical protein
MSASYSNAKTVLDLPTFLAYVRKTFPTAMGATNADGVNVVVTFSAALTSPQQTTLTALVAAYVDPKTGVVDTTQVSVFNTSATALAANGVYTGAWEDVSRYTSVIVSTMANVGSAAGGLSVQFGNIAAQADSVKTFTTVAATAFSMALPVAGRYLRVVYTNGGTLQASFSLQTKFSIVQVSAVADASTTVDDTTSALLTRNLNMARTDRGAYTSVRGDESSVLRTRATADSFLSTNAVSTPVAQLDFHYNVNANLVNTTLVTSGTVSQALGMATVSTAALAASSAIMSSRRYVTCGAGRCARVVISCAFTAGATGSTQLAGVGDADNGLFWGFNGTAFGVLVRSATVDTWTPATAFNVDKLAGAGPSGVTLVPTNGNVYTITYDGTGFGGAVFGIGSTPAASTTDTIVAHRVAFGNTATATGLRIPNAPLWAQATNASNTSALSLKVAAMAAYQDGAAPAVIGRCRAVDYAQSVASTAYVPVLTLLNKTTYQAVNNKASLVLQGLSLSSDGTKGSVIVCINDAPALTGASYADISTNTTPAQLDTSATSFTGGTTLFSACVQCASEMIIDLSRYDVRVAPGQWVTVGVRCTAPDASSAVAVALTFKEDL